MKTKQLTTEVWSLRFQLNGNELGFTIRKPEGTEKRYWVDMPPKMAKAVSKAVMEHIQAQEEEAKLTPAQLAEKYTEYFT